MFLDLQAFVITKHTAIASDYLNLVDAVLQTEYWPT